jgi:hypothetical protein
MISFRVSARSAALIGPFPFSLFPKCKECFDWLKRSCRRTLVMAESFGTNPVEIEYYVFPDLLNKSHLTTIYLPVGGNVR